MAYKFQLGGAILSGAVNVKGDLTASTDVSGALVNISASNFLAAGGLQMTRVTASLNFNAVGGDGLMWLNSQDGKVVAMTPTAFAGNLAGDGLKATTGSVVVNVDDATINIDADKIQVKDEGVGTDQIASASVTRPKIGRSAVGPEQILFIDDGLSATTTHFLIADGTDYSSFALSGDVTATNAGVVSIGNNKIVTNLILSGAVTGPKIGDQQIVQRNLATGSVEVNAIKQGAVTMAALATGSVETAAFASGSVTRAKIAGQAVNVEQLSADVAGEGLAGANGTPVSLDVSSLTTVLTGSALDGLDVFAAFDVGAGEQKKSTLADIATKMAGSGITATNGVLAVGAVTGSGDSITVTAIADGDDCVAGINYFTGTIQPGEGKVDVSLPASPTVGDVVMIKAPSNCGPQNRVEIGVQGSHKIDGITDVILDDTYAAVNFVYVVANKWSIV